MHIEPVDPGSTDVLAMIKALDQYQGELYPPESNHLDTTETLVQSNVVMIGAKDETGLLMGIGATKFMDGYAEIKRMFIPPEHRKKGIATAILSYLEKTAIDNGMPLLRLETGIHQTPAIALYQAAGFYKISNFGDYPDDPLSVFMEKTL